MMRDRLWHGSHAHKRTITLLLHCQISGPIKAQSGLFEPKLDLRTDAFYGESIGVVSGY